jgi:hypothetical protein
MDGRCRGSGAVLSRGDGGRGEEGTSEKNEGEIERDDRKKRLS